MKTQVLSIFLILLFCLTSGCGKAEQQNKTPDGISFSGSKTEEAPDANTSQAEEIFSAHTPESQSAEAQNSTTTEKPESDDQTESVPDQPKDGATPPQISEPQQKTDESENRSEPPSSAPQQPTEEKTTEPTENTPQPTEPPQEEPTEPAFDIGYWIGFAKSYAESVGLTLNSEAVYCWDNPIDADAGCIYLERDIQSRLNRYAADADITDVWIWYEPVSAGSYLIYIGYA